MNEKRQTVRRGLDIDERIRLAALYDATEGNTRRVSSTVAHNRFVEFKRRFCEWGAGDGNSAAVARLEAQVIRKHQAVADRVLATDSLQ
jgi:hypothetical protein